MSEKPQENILIGYTKWLLKWVAILCVIAGVVGGGIWGYTEYQNQLVPMVAIKCESDIKKGKPLFYLIQKRRDETVPHALYRPAYYIKNITKDLSPSDYWQQYFYQENKEWCDKETKKCYPAARFAPFSQTGEGVKEEHWVVRETLQVIYWVKEKDQKKWTQSLLKHCAEIPADAFQAESERGLREEQSKLKF